MPAWAPPARHVLDMEARLQGRGAGSDMNEAFIQEPERPGASLKDVGTQKRALGVRTGADGPCGSCLSSFLRGYSFFNDSWFAWYFGASKTGGHLLPPMHPGVWEGEQAATGRGLITTECGCLPGALRGTTGSKLSIQGAVSALWQG